MGQLRIFNLEIYLFLIIGLAQSGKQGSLLRFCKNGNKVEYSRAHCLEGILFENKGTSWDCLCSKGSWILTRSICEQSSAITQIPYFIYSNKPKEFNCFHHTEFEPFGGSFIYSSPIGSSGGKFGKGVPLLLTSQHGVIIRPELTEFGFHFILHPEAHCHQNGGKFRFWILLVDPTRNLGARLNDDPFALCLLAENYVNRNGVRMPYKGIYLYDVSTLCANRFRMNEETVFLTLAEECEYEDGAEWLDMIPTQVKNTLNSSRSDPNVCDPCQGKRPQDLSGVDKTACQEGGDCTAADILDRNLLEYNLDLQSSRIGLHLLDKVLKVTPPEHGNGDGEEFEPVEIKILTKGALIALKACAPSIIPIPFYQYFLILFKALLSESFVKYPPWRSLLPESQEWIEGALTNCQQRTTLFDIKMEDECLRSEVIRRSNGKGHGIDIPVPVRVPEHFKWNPDNDALIEFIWKLGSFLVYHCFEDFAQGTTYHYELRAQLESLFSDELLLRWMNPSNSNRMYAHLLEPHLDMELTMTNFDLCVGAAHAGSKYGDDIWLKRPIDIIPNYANSWFQPSSFRQKREAPENKSSEQDRRLDRETEFRLTSSKYSTSLSPDPQDFVCIKNLDSFLNATQIPMEKCW